MGILKGRRRQVVLGEKKYIQNKITHRNNSVLAPEWIKLFNKFKTKEIKTFSFPPKNITYTIKRILLFMSLSRALCPR